FFKQSEKQESRVLSSGRKDVLWKLSLVTMINCGSRGCSNPGSVQELLGFENITENSQLFRSLHDEFSFTVDASCPLTNADLPPDKSRARGSSFLLLRFHRIIAYQCVMGAPHINLSQRKRYP
ncbi:jg3030, partial [Pararge aegeria aegeria]